VLDKRGSPTFSLRDMELLGVFAGQAAAAIAATRLQRDVPALLATSLRQVDGELAAEEVEAIVSAATRDLDRGGERPFWALVDQVSRLRDLGEAELELVAAILGVVADRPVRRRR
jgi:hypothetical protein